VKPAQGGQNRVLGDCWRAPPAILPTASFAQAAMGKPPKRVEPVQSSNEVCPAAGEALAISIPGSEAAVIRHFRERMPHGLFVPVVP
jgi:hypothetical protein